MRKQEAQQWQIMIAVALQIVKEVLCVIKLIKLIKLIIKLLMYVSVVNAGVSDLKSDCRYSTCSYCRWMEIKLN